MCSRLTNHLARVLAIGLSLMLFLPLAWGDVQPQIGTAFGSSSSVKSDEVSLRQPPQSNLSESSSSSSAHASSTTLPAGQQPEKISTPKDRTLSWEEKTTVAMTGCYSPTGWGNAAVSGVKVPPVDHGCISVAQTKAHDGTGMRTYTHVKTIAGTQTNNAISIKENFTQPAGPATSEASISECNGCGDAQLGLSVRQVVQKTGWVLAWVPNYLFNKVVKPAWEWVSVTWQAMPLGAKIAVFVVAIVALIVVAVIAGAFTAIGAGLMWIGGVIGTVWTWLSGLSVVQFAVTFLALLLVSFLGGPSIKGDAQGEYGAGEYGGATSKLGGFMQTFSNGANTFLDETYFQTNISWNSKGLTSLSFQGNLPVGKLFQSPEYTDKNKDSWSTLPPGATGLRIGFDFKKEDWFGRAGSASALGSRDQNRENAASIGDYLTGKMPKVFGPKSFINPKSIDSNIQIPGKSLTCRMDDSNCNKVAREAMDCLAGADLVTGQNLAGGGGLGLGMWLRLIYL